MTDDPAVVALLEAPYPCREAPELVCEHYHPACIMDALNRAGWIIVVAGDVRSAIGRVHGQSVILPPHGVRDDAVGRLRQAVLAAP